MFVHARIAGAGLQGFLFACALAAGAQAAESQRWQVVSANEIKVGHALVTRTANDSNVLESERIEIHLGKTNRRVRYRMIVETESAPDGALRRVSREVQTSEGHSRVEARVVDDALEVTHGLGSRADHRAAGRRGAGPALGRSRAHLARGRGPRRKPRTVQLPILGSREARSGRCRAGAQFFGGRQRGTARALIARHDGFAAARRSVGRHRARDHGAGLVPAHAPGRQREAGAMRATKCSTTSRPCCRNRRTGFRRAT